MPFNTKEKKVAWAKEYYRKNRKIVRKKQSEYRLRTLESERARHRRNNIKQYGIDEAGYLKLFDEQKGVCLICSLPQLTKRLHIDHNHATGKIRGLLCENCNRGLGMFKENKTTLLLAIKYLDEKQS